MPRTISCPYSGCSSMTRRSSAVSGPSLRSTRVGHAELADVVQDPGEPEHLERGPRPCPVRGRSARRPARPARCGRGCTVLDVDGLHQRPDRGLVGGALAVVLREDPAGDVHRQQHEQRGDAVRTGCATARPSSARRARARRCGASEREQQPAPGARAAAAARRRRGCRRRGRSATRQKASAAAAAGSSAYGKSGAPQASARRPSSPARTPAPRAQAASASWAARQSRRAPRGPLLDPAEQRPGQRRRARRRRAAAGRRAASSTGKKEPAPTGTQCPAAAAAGVLAHRRRARRAAATRPPGPGRTAGQSGSSAAAAQSTAHSDVRTRRRRMTVTCPSPASSSRAPGERVRADTAATDALGSAPTGEHVGVDIERVRLRGS